VEFVSGSMGLPLIPPGNVFEKDLVGRAADNMRNFATFECYKYGHLNLSYFIIGFINFFNECHVTYSI